MDEKSSGSTTVLIIDNTASRANFLKDKLTSAGASVAWVQKVQGKLHPPAADLPNQVDILFVHAGDKSLLSEVSKDRKFCRVIYYGGRGGSDPRIPAKAERIFRPISIAGGHLTGQEAAQLVRYGDPQSAGPEPALLSPAPSFPLLRTLGVLCVGYLAVHVAKRLGPSPPIPSDVEARRLGWAALPDGERQRFSTSLLSYEEEVNSPAWWHDLIVAAAGSLEKLPAQLKRELRQAQARGLVDPTAVERLVAELLKDHEHAPRPESIEAAFQSLAALEQW